MENLPEQFQKLTSDDQAVYGQPEIIYLDPPKIDDPNCSQKRMNWINWRAAPYPTMRHSEYLYIPEIDEKGGPAILISAILKTPNSLNAYISQIKSKARYTIRGRKALARRYSARQIVPAEESSGIWKIIHSSDTRQEREIDPMFADRPPDYNFPEYQLFDNPNYEDICCGVFSPEGELAAYLLGKRVGDHVQYDEIMGHNRYLGDDIMYLLHITFLQMCIEKQVPPKHLNYGTWYSGYKPFSPEGGLNRWKRKINFKPAYLILASS
jgi:hypothetical protein